MKIFYNCAKCGQQLEIEQDDVIIQLDVNNRFDGINQDYDLLDFDCHNCKHENLLKIYIEVE